MKQILTLFGLLTFSSTFGQLPPVYFGTNQTYCDPTPYQQVVDDEFDGTSLNSFWYPFYFYINMPPPSDNWELGRYNYNSDHHDASSIMKDANVEVSNGTLKLKVVKEPSSWQCASCGPPIGSPGPLITTNYSSSWVQSDYLFNSGRFEASIRMTKFPFAHYTMWLWGGNNNPGQDEVDMMEDYSNQTNPPPTANSPLILTSNLHQWTNGLEISIGTPYPAQEWWTIVPWHIMSQPVDISAFHTYACEWDTAVINPSC